MKRAKRIRWAALAATILVAACQSLPFVSPSASPTPLAAPSKAPTTPAPPPTLTATPYIPEPVATAVPSTATATATLFVPSEVPPSPTLFIPPPVPSIAPKTMTLAFAPGVYVTGMRLDPPQPLQRQDVTFYVTFLNTTGVEQKYRWFIFIFREDQVAPFGQTSSDKTYIIPPGTSEQPSVNTWKMGPGQPCTNLTAEVHWLGPDGTGPAFSSPGGRDFVMPFTVCPPP